MNFYKLVLIIVAVVLLFSTIEAKKKKKEKSSKSQTKTKWSTTTDLGPNGPNTAVATEEHGYYVKRTFLPLDSSDNSKIATPKSPPYLAIPIAWFKCDGNNCINGNSAIINSNANALNEGFLCEDDCLGPYQPICGRTTNEIAVFYNKCKLNVAKCRTHGLWNDLFYGECKQLYPNEVEYTDKKFRSSPFFCDDEKSEVVNVVLLDDHKDNMKPDDDLVEPIVVPLKEIGEKMTEVTTEDNGKLEADKVEPVESSTALVTGIKNVKN